MKRLWAEWLLLGLLAGLLSKALASFYGPILPVRTVTWGSIQGRPYTLVDANVGGVPLPCACTLSLEQAQREEISEALRDPKKTPALVVYTNPREYARALQVAEILARYRGESVRMLLDPPQAPR